MARVTPSELHIAVLSGDVKATRKLIRDGWDSAGRDGFGRTPLQWAVVLGHEDITKALIVNTPLRFLHSADRHGRNVIHYAAAQGRADLLRVLIQRGGNVDSRDCLQTTPLHFAATAVDSAVAEILLDKGADVFAVDASGLTPMDYAVRHGSAACEELFRSKMRLLCAKDAADEAEDESSASTESSARYPLATLDANAPLCAASLPSRPINASEPLLGPEEPAHNPGGTVPSSSCTSASSAPSSAPSSALSSAPSSAPSSALSSAPSSAPSSALSSALSSAPPSAPSIPSIPSATPSFTNKATPSSALESLFAAWKSSCEKSRLGESQATLTNKATGDHSSPSRIYVSAPAGAAAAAGDSGPSAMEWAPCGGASGSLSCGVAGTCSGLCGQLAAPCGILEQAGWHSAERPSHAVCC